MDENGKCGAKTRGGGTCKRSPSLGATRCRLHGGATPRSRAAAERRLAEAAATKVLATYGRPVDTNPIEALLDEVRWTAGHVAWLRERVQELEAEQLTWGVVEEVDKTASEFPGTDTTRAARVNVWLDLYGRERKHLVDVCKAAIAAGIAERQVRLAESQGAMLAGVIRAILDDLDLTAEQRAKAMEVVPQRLRAVA